MISKRRRHSWRRWTGASTMVNWLTTIMADTINRSLMRSMLRVCLFVATGLFVGCGKSVTTSELVGTWIPQAASQKWLATTNVCQIVFQSNGAFTASVPDRMLGTSDQAVGKVVSGHGRWVVERKSKLELGNDIIKLIFDDFDGKQVNYTSERLRIQGGKDRAQLFFYVAEEGGQRFVFVQTPRALESQSQ